MKTIKFLFFSIAFLLSIQHVIAQESGIQFDRSVWADVLKSAKANNKLIFLDAYTTWCGPCKMMTKNVFPDKAVGEYFNANFVSVKMDMEKGEGIELAKNYNIKAYPTLLFVDGDGNLVHRYTGYLPIDEFIALGKTANDPSKRLSTLDEKYKNGDRSPEFLFHYAYNKMESFDGSHIPVAEAYLDTQKDWATDENLQFIFDMMSDTESKMFDYFISNREKFEKKFDTQKIFERVDGLVMSKIQKNDAPVSLDEVDALFKKVYPEEAKRMSLSFRMSYFLQQDNIDEYTKAAIKYFDKYDESAEDLNEGAWMFYQSVESKRKLKKAVKWAKKSIAINDSFYNNDTLASLYFKLNKKDKAKSTALKAIQKAKELNEDSTSTEELLKEIEAM